MRLRTRTGFSVVEVLVALMVVSVGLLGIAGTSALSLSTANAASRERRATRRAAARLALLTAGGCERATSGAVDDTDVHEQWTVAPFRGGVMLIDERVDWRGSDARLRSVILPGALLC